MTPESYIVECANWKSKIDYSNTANYNKIEDKIIEAATLSFEYIFANTYESDKVIVFSLKDASGTDYFESMKMKDTPDPLFALLTKVYKLEDEQDEEKHYFVLTKVILENASLPHMLIELKEFEKMIKKQNKPFYKNLIDIFKNNNVITNLK